MLTASFCNNTLECTKVHIPKKCYLLRFLCSLRLTYLHSRVSSLRYISMRSCSPLSPVALLPVLSPLETVFFAKRGGLPHSNEAFLQNRGGKFSLHACEIVLKVKLFKKFEELHQISTRTHPTRKRKFHANEWVCPTRNSLFCKNEWGRLDALSMKTGLKGSAIV